MSAAGAERPLAGRGIVITRPAHQAQSLAAMVREAGGRAILFPVIEIEDAKDLRAFNAAVDRLGEFDLAVFVSPNAVNRAMNLLAVRRVSLPPNLAIAAVGRATARALEGRGVAGVIAPARGVDSEALLALPALCDVRGKRVVVFRGEGGREVLADTLAARGARVEYAECYRRGIPPLDPAPLMNAWSSGELHAFVVTSSEGLNNLVTMIGDAGARRLAATPLFVPHPRITQTAHTLGLGEVVTSDPGDEGLFRALCRYFGARA